MKKVLITTSLIGLLTAFQPVWAHEDEEPAHKHSDVLKATTAQEALAEIQKVMATIDGIVASGNGDALHPEIEKVEASAEALKAQAVLDIDKKTRLEAAVKQFTKQLDKVHDALDEKDKSTAEANLKKAHSALKLVENALK